MRKETQPLADWANGKPLGVTLPAILAASSTEDVRQFLEQRRTRSGLFASEPAIDEPQRLRFYRSHKLLQHQLLAELGDSEDGTLSEILGALQHPQTAKPWATSSAAAAIFAAYARPDGEFSEALSEETLADEDEEPLDASRPATAFYLWVHLPCWLVYGVTPTELLRRVNEGGKAAETAARQMIRLDRTAMRTPSIRRWAKGDGKHGKYRGKKLLKWASQAPFDKSKSPSRALKIVAARLSRLSELMDRRLNTPDLRQLFEACQPPTDLQAYLTNTTDDDLGRAIRRIRQQFGVIG